jgi:flagellar biosynthesis protein FlhG
MTPERKAEETFYDVLKVDPRATIAEIVAAYHTAKNAFSRESMATYSLFSPDETQAILSKLDEAYQTLSNIEKKRDYDQLLAERTQEGRPMPAALTELELKQKAQLLPPAESQEKKPGESPAEKAPAAGPLPAYETITGAILKEIREKRALALEDVSRITKIPIKFIQAIESQEPGALPARVYLQGFVKNLAVLYKLDPKTTVTAYLKNIDKPRT